MLRLVIPMSLSDIHLLNTQVELFCRLGGTPNHEVWLCPTSTVLSQAKQAKERMEPFTKSCQVIEWEMDNIRGWPEAGNFMFQHVVHEIERRGESAFYFYELDNTPMKPGWLDLLETRYVMSGCLYMGAVVPTRKEISGQVFVDEVDTHMVGTGIYPPNLNKHTDGQFKFATYKVPWDIMLRFYFRRSLHQTPLIQHRWSTINYQEVDGKIVCENDPKNPFGTDHSGEVDGEAVVVHGCKDGSLAKLVLAKLGEAVIPQVIAPVSVAVPDDAPKPQAGVQYDSAGFKTFQMLSHKTEPVVVKPPPLTVEAPKVQYALGEPVPKPSEVKFEQPEGNFKEAVTTKEQEEQIQKALGEEVKKAPMEIVMETIKAHPKAMRVADLAKLVHLTPLRLRKMADLEDCPFEVTAKGGWVKVKEMTTA